MFVLGIESTCDETACAVVKDGIHILSNVVASQAEMHQKWGGVYPELASRQHVEIMLPILQQSLEEAALSHKDIDLIAVARGPGLVGPLLMGLNAAKSLSLAWNIPFVGVNHIEAHLYAAMMSSNVFEFPAIGLVISGGHTFLVHIHEIGSYTLIGTTVDDAIGEAFDKIAQMLELPYPGGPEIEKLALIGDAKRYSFKPGHVKGFPWNFSFSGMKTNVLYTIKGQNHSQPNRILSLQEKADIAASFQRCAFNEIVRKTREAAQTYPSQAIYIGGGVSNNHYLRECFRELYPNRAESWNLDRAKAPGLDDRKSVHISNIDRLSIIQPRELSHGPKSNFQPDWGINLPIYWPSKGLSLDNAAMIAGLGYHIFQNKPLGDSLDLEPQMRIPL